MSDVTDYLSNFDDPFGTQDAAHDAGQRARREAIAREWAYYYRIGDTAGMQRIRKQHPATWKLIQKGRYAYIGVSPTAGRPGLDQPKHIPGRNPLYSPVDKLAPIGAPQLRTGLGGVLQKLSDPGRFLRGTAYGAIIGGIYDQLPQRVKLHAVAATKGLASILTGNYAGIAASVNTIGTDLYGSKPRVDPFLKPPTRRDELGPIIPTARYIDRYGRKGPADLGDPLEDPRSGPYRPYRPPGLPDPRLVPGGVPGGVAATLPKPTTKPVPTGSKTSKPGVSPGNPQHIGRPAPVPLSKTKNPFLQKFLSTLGDKLPGIALEYFKSKRRSTAPRIFVGNNPFADPPAQPAGQPSPLPLTAVEAAQAGCTCPKKQPAKERGPREICYSGRFIERSFGLQKSGKRRVPCRPSKKKLP